MIRRQREGQRDGQGRITSRERRPTRFESVSRLTGVLETLFKGRGIQFSYRDAAPGLQARLRIKKALAAADTGAMRYLINSMGMTLTRDVKKATCEIAFCQPGDPIGPFARLIFS